MSPSDTTRSTFWASTERSTSVRASRLEWMSEMTAKRIGLLVTRHYTTLPIRGPPCFGGSHAPRRHWLAGLRLPHDLPGEVPGALPQRPDAPAHGELPGGRHAPAPGRGGGKHRLDPGPSGWEAAAHRHCGGGFRRVPGGAGPGRCGYLRGDGDPG